MPFDGSNTKESRRTKVLRLARELITHPRNWITGTLRATKYDPETKQSYQAFCFLGALQEADRKVCGATTVYSSTVEFVGQFALFDGIDASHSRLVRSSDEAGMRIAGLNNTLGHAVVLATLDKSIAASEQADLIAA